MIACYGCGKIKLETNRWWRLRPHVKEMRYEVGPIELGINKHCGDLAVCGENCLARLESAVRNGELPAAAKVGGGG